jgi:hypothetical protein
MSENRRREIDPGPFESHTFAERLVARAVQPGPAPRLHGYDVEADLARHYSFGEAVLLALVGAPPDRATGRAFETTLLFLGAVSVAEAPVHAAVLGRLCGTSASGALGAGAIALCEQARFALEHRADLLAWLAADAGPDPAPASLPEACRARDDDDRASVARLLATLDGEGPACRALSLDPSPEAALLAMLFACGLRTTEQLEAALLVARLPFLAAEALAAGPWGLRDYPMCLPPFRYVEEDP